MSSVINEQTKVGLGLILAVLAFVVAPAGWVLTKINEQSERSEKDKSEMREMVIKTQGEVLSQLRDQTMSIKDNYQQLIVLVKDNKTDLVTMLNQQELKMTQQISDIRSSSDSKLENLQREIASLKIQFLELDRKSDDKVKDRWTTQEQERFLWVLSKNNPSIKVPELRDIRPN